MSGQTPPYPNPNPRWPVNPYYPVYPSQKLLLPLESESDQVHTICCRPTVALCGEKLDGVITSKDTPLTCTQCAILEEEFTVCGARFCRVRSWFRAKLRGLVDWDLDDFYENPR